MTLVDVMRVFQKFWALIILMLAAGLATAAIALLLVPSTYTSESRLFVSTQSLGTADELLQGSTYTQARMLSYARIASDPIVLDPVIARLDLDTSAEELASSVSASAERDQLIIDISADADSAVGASDIANAVADQLAEVITETIEAPVAGSDPLVSVTVVKYATPSPEPSWPVLWIFLTVGGVAGALLGVGLSFLLSALDTRVRNLDDITRIVAVPLIGMVSKDRRVQRHQPMAMLAGSNTFAESIRGIRTNLQFIDAGGIKRRILLMTSSVPGEGKSTTSLSLAASLAEADNRVIIIDADLRSPSLAKLTGLEGSVGLTDILLGRLDVRDAIQPIGATGNLFAVTSGRLPPNPAELLASKTFAEFISALRQEADYIIIDSPPVLAVADAFELARVADGVALIVGVERVRRPQLETAIGALRQVGAPLIGVVANRLARTGVDAYGYYAYGYQSQAAEEARRNARSQPAASDVGDDADDDTPRGPRRTPPAEPDESPEETTDEPTPEPVSARADSAASDPDEPVSVPAATKRRSRVRGA